MVSRALAGLYHDDIVALARGGVFAGKVSGGVCAVRTNPLCGDECIVSAECENGVVVRALHQTRGCLLCLAAAEKACALAADTGDFARLRRLIDSFELMMRGEGGALPELALFAPVIAKKSRRACVLLPFRALGEIVK